VVECNLTFLEVGSRHPKATEEIQEVKNFSKLYSNKHIINIHKFFKRLA